MKKILFLAVILCCIGGFQSCKLDNFDEPSATLMGALVDSETNENVPCQYQNGSRIRMYEFYNGNWANQPNDFYTRQDGTFTNKALFPGKYKIEVEGAFETPQPVELEISGTKELPIQVIPFLRISAEATASGNSIRLTATLQRTASTRKIKTVGFYCNKTPYVDKNTFASEESRKETDLSGKTDAEITSTTFSETFTGLASGQTYYVRVGALAENPGNYFNYSKVIEVKVP